MSKTKLVSDENTKELFARLKNLVNRYDLPEELDIILEEILDRKREGTIIGADELAELNVEKFEAAIGNTECQNLEYMEKINYLNGYVDGMKEITATMQHRYVNLMGV